MQNKHKRILSTGIVFILTIGFLILFFSIIIPNTIDSVRQFSKNVASYSDTLIGYTKDFAYKLNISEKQVEQLLINFDITKKITSVLTESIPKIASYSYRFVKGFINIILALTKNCSKYNNQIKKFILRNIKTLKLTFLLCLVLGF